MRAQSKSIVFITPSYAPAIGGVEKHVQRTAQALADRGYHMTVVVPSAAGTHVETPGVKVVPIRIRLFSSNPLNLWEARKILRAADVIHAHDYLMGFAAWPWARLFRKQLYVTFHGWEGRTPPRLMVKLFRRWLERRADGALLIGSYLQKWYGHTSRAIAYGGADTEPGNNPPDRAPSACFLGRIAEDTGIRQCLEVFTQLVQAEPQWQLVVAGNGPLRQELEQFTMAKKLPVRWAGWISEPREIFRQTSVCFTSGYLAIIEALQNHQIVVASAGTLLKTDYLVQSPFRQNIIVAGDPAFAVVSITQHLSGTAHFPTLDLQRFTWGNVASVYERLWQQGKQLTCVQ